MAKQKLTKIPQRASEPEPEPESHEKDIDSEAPEEEQETELEEQEEAAEGTGGEQSEEEEEEVSTIPDTEEYQKADNQSYDLAALNYSVSLLAKEVRELRNTTISKLEGIHGLIAKNLKRGRSPVVPGGPRAKRRSGTPQRGQYED